MIQLFNETLLHPIETNSSYGMVVGNSMTFKELIRYAGTN